MNHDYEEENIGVIELMMALEYLGCDDEPCYHRAAEAVRTMAPVPKDAVKEMVAVFQLAAGGQTVAEVLDNGEMDDAYYRAIDKGD